MLGLDIMIMQRDISSIMLEMMTAINLKKADRPNWQKFIAYLTSHLDAEYGQLSVNGIDFFSGSELLTKSDCVVEHCYSMNKNVLSVIFLFSNDQTRQFAEKKLAFIQHHVNNILQLATAQEQTRTRRLVASACAERANVGLVTLDCKGRVINKNKMAESLLENELFSCRHNQLTFTDSPKWLEKQFKELHQKENDSVYLTLQWHEKIVHCVLSKVHQSEKSMHYLQPQTSQFLLMVYLADTPPSIAFLQQLYSLNEAEAMIVSWFSLGLSAEHVAKKTGYTVHTVYSYIKKLYSTMNIHKQSQLTAQVWQQQPL